MHSIRQRAETYRQRFEVWRDDVRESLWFTPALLTVGLAVLAVTLVAVDRELVFNGRLDSSSGIFQGGIDGSRGVLTAIAGSLIAAAATVFSITVVVLQLASSQFTPRVLRSFTSDRQFQTTLGILLGTFVYSLIVLWSVGHEEPDRVPFVPTVATAMAIILALISVAVLIAFIHRVSSLIQVSMLVDRVTRETIELIHRRYVESGDPAAAENHSNGLPEEGGEPVLSARAGYIRYIDSDALLRVADERMLILVITRPIGAFLLPGVEIARVSPAVQLDEDLVSQIQREFTIEPERSAMGDVEFGVRQVSDIAVKSLSPAINDPTTAINCIDRLMEILYEVAVRDSPPIMRHGKSGGVLIFEPVPGAKQLVDEAFAQIRHYGAGDVLVSCHLALKLGELATVVSQDLGPAFEREALLVVASCKNAGMLPADLERVERCAAWANHQPDSGVDSPGRVS